MLGVEALLPNAAVPPAQPGRVLPFTAALLLDVVGFCAEEPSGWICDGNGEDCPGTGAAGLPVT
jgi:hypothetical protein